MRRKVGALVPFEREILAVAARLTESGSPEFWGYLLAAELRGPEKAEQVARDGSLYKALRRLVAFGYLSSRWENERVDSSHQGARRRLYRLVRQPQGGDASPPSCARPSRCGRSNV
jgi:hypothetical protein